MYFAVSLAAATAQLIYWEKQVGTDFWKQKEQFVFLSLARVNYTMTDKLVSYIMILVFKNLIPRFLSFMSDDMQQNTFGLLYNLTVFSTACKFASGKSCYRQ